jgi:hypothetical protein
MFKIIGLIGLIGFVAALAALPAAALAEDSAEWLRQHGKGLFSFF